MTTAIPTIHQTCGTYGGYQRHRKRGEIACGPCRTANATYQRQWRGTNTARYANERRRSNARIRALWRLADLHYEEYTALYIEEVS